MYQVLRACEISLNKYFKRNCFGELVRKLVRKVSEDSFVRKFREFRSERRLRSDA